MAREKRVIFIQRKLEKLQAEVSRLRDALVSRRDGYADLILAALRMYDACGPCPMCESRNHTDDCPIARLLCSAEDNSEDMDDT